MVAATNQLRHIVPVLNSVACFVAARLNWGACSRDEPKPFNKVGVKTIPLSEKTNMVILYRAIQRVAGRGECQDRHLVDADPRLRDNSALLCKNLVHAIDVDSHVVKQLGWLRLECLAVHIALLDDVL